MTQYPSRMRELARCFFSFLQRYDAQGEAEVLRTEEGMCTYQESDLVRAVEQSYYQYRRLLRTARIADGIDAVSYIFKVPFYVELHRNGNHKAEGIKLLLEEADAFIVPACYVTTARKIIREDAKQRLLQKGGEINKK